MLESPKKRCVTWLLAPGSCRLLAPSGSWILAPGSWLLLAPGSSCPLVPAGSSRLLLTPPGSWLLTASWFLLAPPGFHGCSLWLLLSPDSSLAPGSSCPLAAVAPPGSSWLLALPAGSWLLLPTGPSWLLLAFMAPPESSWILLPPWEPAEQPGAARRSQEPGAVRRSQGTALQLCLCELSPKDFIFSMPGEELGGGLIDMGAGVWMN